MRYRKGLNLDKCGIGQNSVCGITNNDFRAAQGEESEATLQSANSSPLLSENFQKLGRALTWENLENGDWKH